jgi:hypothetical protein
MRKSGAVFFRTFDSLEFAASPRDIRDALEFLRPKPSPWDFIRLGGSTDGAYLVPNSLDGIVACLSPGVRNSKKFEDELAHEHGIRSHLLDFSSDLEKFSTPLIKGMQTFTKKWLGAASDKTTVTLAEWIEAAEPDPSKDLMLQIDIEGAEWPILRDIDPEVLRRFRVIVIELHKLDDIFSSPALFDEKAAEAFAKLRGVFTVIHAHPNNCCGSSSNLFGSGMRIPRTLELTMVRTDFLETALKAGKPRHPELPHPLDIGRNVPGSPPIFLGSGWRSTQPRWGTVFRILLQSLSYEILWRWKKLIPAKLYRAIKPSPAA